jgi:hypothetical protein
MNDLESLIYEKYFIEKLPFKEFEKWVKENVKPQLNNENLNRLLNFSYGQENAKSKLSLLLFEILEIKSKLKDINNYLKSLYREDEAYLSLSIFNDEMEEISMEANKDGLILFICEILDTIEKIESLPPKKEAINQLKYFEKWNIIDGAIISEIFLLKEERADILSDEIPIKKNHSMIDIYLFPIGCFSVLGFCLLCLIIGFLEIIGWIF